MSKFEQITAEYQPTTSIMRDAQKKEYLGDRKGLEKLIHDKVLEFIEMFMFEIFNQTGVLFNSFWIPEGTYGEFNIGGSSVAFKLDPSFCDMLFLNVDVVENVSVNPLQCSERYDFTLAAVDMDNIIIEIDHESGEVREHISKMVSKGFFVKV